MEMMDLDWEEAAAQRLTWRAEIATLKDMVARAEAETQAEFNILLATMSSEQPTSWERLPPRSTAAARQVEVQLQEWGATLRELKVIAAHAEAAATEAHDVLLTAALVNAAVGRDQRQAARAGSTARVFCHQKCGVDIAMLRARAARATTEVKDAYSAMLTALRTKGAMARQQRRMLFSLPVYR